MSIPQGFGRPSLPTSEHEARLMEQSAQNYQSNLCHQIHTLKTQIEVLREALKSCARNDTSRPYAHHAPRPSDGKRPEETESRGTVWKTPREIVQDTLKEEFLL